MKKFFAYLFIATILFSCSSQKEENSNKSLVNKQRSKLEYKAPQNTDNQVFKLKSATESGIDFVNSIKEDELFHHLSWESIYYGGGVALADINNDGLVDVFLTGNQRKDAIYLNKGNLKFEDITANAGINKGKGWSSGVTFADVNNDGFQDFYVCKLWGDFDNKKANYRINELYINNGDLTFTESAAKFKIADTGYSTQSTFFDMDNDGDLDLFIANNPSNNFKQKLIYMDKNAIDYQFSNKLYRNENGKYFTDVSKKAGVEEFTYSLGIIANDINKDGFVDLYVANDYEKPDRYLINQKNGTFKDYNKNYFKHTSYSSMGLDVGDINNDLLPDLAVLDMQASDHFRSKTNMAAMDEPTFWKNIRKGYNYQYMSNALQLNNGNAMFSEIAQLCGIASTDWSWSLLMADFDNNSFKDIFITNGINKDIRNNDFVESLKQNKKAKGNDREIYLQAIKAPVIPIKNYAFQNNGNLDFENQTDNWGLAYKGFSFGSAYADLDNDGDLDLIICNNEDNIHLYENIKGNQKNYLQIQVKNPKNLNQFFNAKAEIYYDDKKQIAELTATRGYQSASECLFHFGLANISSVDELEIKLLNGKSLKLKNVKTNQRLKVDLKDFKKHSEKKKDQNFLCEYQGEIGLKFNHIENQFVDYDREKLLPHLQSRNGPFVSSADVNNDGLEDVFIGGAKNQSAVLFIQNRNKTFKTKKTTAFRNDKNYEDMASVFFDFDKDGDKDLYVVSGGSEAELNSKDYLDRLYLNDGNGNFSKTKNKIAANYFNESCVIAADIDNDGDEDLFVGGRGIPGAYPKAGRSQILINESGRLTNNHNYLINNELGMITKAIFSDFNNDKKLDLIVVGEWMKPTFLKNTGSKFVDVSKTVIPEKMEGWYFSITEADLNKDGFPDYVLGNAGMNNKYKATSKKPLLVYGNDFDGNKTNDVVLAKTTKDGILPVRGKQCSSEQVPLVSDKFKSFESFALADLESIYGNEKLEKSVSQSANNFYSGILINQKNGKFKFKKLPVQAQFSVVQDILITDVNKDNKEDIIIAGNLFDAEVETVRHDSGNGLFLINQGNFNFEAMPLFDSGFYAPLNCRDLHFVDYGKNKLIVVANNDNRMQVYELKK